jgi:hypothetical protein
MLICRRGCVPPDRATATVKSLCVVWCSSRRSGAGGAVEEGVDEAAHGSFGEVAAFAVVPFPVLFEMDGADEAGDGTAVGKIWTTRS